VAKSVLTQEELLALPVTVDVVTAGRAFGVSRDGTYDLLRRGEFPVRTVKVGRSRRVPRAELFRVLGVTDPIHSRAVSA
jgi:Helix-turn-helix domain